jgi:hypothetical protein
MFAPDKISKSSVVLFLGLLVAAALLWAGAKPWKSKPYQTWDAKDLQSIMTESPWVQITTVRRSWLPMAEKDVPPSQEIAGGMQHFPSATAGPGSNPAANPAATNRESEGSTRELNVYLYWYSSRVIRAASAREAVLHGVLRDSEVEKFTNTPQEEYEIALRMADMTPFIRKDAKFYQDNAILQMRRSKLNLPPNRVVYEDAATGRVKDVVFFFPKKTSSGLPTITSDETDVAFTCRVADSTLHVDFKPRKMIDQFGTDL